MAKKESATPENSVQSKHLEIVTPDVDSVCKIYSQMRGLTFKDAIQILATHARPSGNAGTPSSSACYEETGRPPPCVV